MAKLNPEIHVHLDENKAERMKFIAVDKGLIAGAFEWRGQLFVRYQIDDPDLMPPETAVKKVREAFGITRADVRTDNRLHLFDDGTELRQMLLGEYEGGK